MGTSHGSAYPKSDTPTTDTEVEPAAAEDDTKVDELIAAMNAPQRGASWRPPSRCPLKRSKDAAKQLDAAGWPPLTWTTASGWRHQVRSFFTTEEGEALRTANPNEKIALDRFLQIAFTMASCAETSTGRGCTAAYVTIARRAGETGSDRACRNAVRRTYKLLEAAGFALLITEGRNYLTKLEREAAKAYHGHDQTQVARTIAFVSPPEMVAIFGNGTTARRHSMRTRRRHTTAPKSARRLPASAPTTPAPQPDAQRQGESATITDTGLTAPTCGGTLSPLGDKSSSSLVRDESPNAPAGRARGDRSRTQASPTAPRSLALQRLGAALIHPVDGIFGLRGQFAQQPGLPQPGTHVGHVCKLLEDVGIDPTRWTAKDIIQRLDDAAARRGATMAIVDATDRLRYLAWCMKRIDWTGPSPSEIRRKAADERAVQRAWKRAQAELDALLAAPAPTEQRRAELRDGWAGQYASTVGRGRTSQHVQSSRADVRAALRTSWKTSPPPAHAGPQDPPPTSTPDHN